MSQVHVRRYVAGGIMMIVGLAVALEARRYGWGSWERVGPGLFPSLLGGLLAFVGMLICLVPDDEEHHELDGHAPPDWRGWSCIIVGLLTFILLGESVGLGPATFGCVFISSLGDRSASLRSAAVAALVATAIAGIFFSWLLNFQLPFIHW